MYITSQALTKLEQRPSQPAHGRQTARPLPLGTLRVQLLGLHLPRPVLDFRQVPAAEPVVPECQCDEGVQVGYVPRVRRKAQ